MHIVYLGLGSNWGNLKGNLTRAKELLSLLIKDMTCSSIYKTKPYGETDQPYFLNAVVKGTTNLSPEDLLLKLKELEKALGRQKRSRWREREIDIDILLYGDLIVHDEHLSIPHADMMNRDFVLVPLLEISPELIDPRSNTLFKNYLQTLETKTIIEKASE